MGCPNWRGGEVINQQDYWGLGTWSREETIFVFPVLLEQANESRADLIRNINRAPRKGETIWNIRVRMLNIGEIGKKPSPSRKTTKGNWIVQLHKYNFNKSWLYIRLCCHALHQLHPPPPPPPPPAIYCLLFARKTFRYKHRPINTEQKSGHTPARHTSVTQRFPHCVSHFINVPHLEMIVEHSIIGPRKKNMAGFQEWM